MVINPRDGGEDEDKSFLFAVLSAMNVYRWERGERRADRRG